jgi:uncharacterized damage-inducible protein DinB
MLDYVKQILAGQFEAALAMLHQCLANCPPEHWEGKIANGTFRQVAYHALFFVDFYLSPSEETFTFRDLHARGGDELQPAPTLGLSQDESLTYLALCREKLREALAAETRESLAGPSGFAYRRFSRGELYIYNLRHVQHHTGQLSAYLRRVDAALADHKALPWVGSGWR